MCSVHGPSKQALIYREQAPPVTSLTPRPRSLEGKAIPQTENEESRRPQPSSLGPWGGSWFLFHGIQSFPGACTSTASWEFSTPSSAALLRVSPAPNQGKDLDTAVPTPALLVNAVQLWGSNLPSLNFSFLKYKLSGPSLKSQIVPVLISMVLLSTLANLFRNLKLVLAGWLGWKPLQGPCSEVLSFTEDNDKPSCCLFWTLFAETQDSLCPPFFD